MAAQRTEYFGALDGLRGLAAVVVVFAHTSAALLMPRPARNALFSGPLAPLMNADGAVLLFFVLSGFVLAGSLSRNRRAVDYAAYGIKRLFRIHPPYVAGVLFAWLASFFYDNNLALTRFLNYRSQIHLSPSKLLEALRFPGNAFDQLPVGWSLEAEMIFSFILPFMLLLTRRSHALLLVALCTGLLWADEPWRYALPFALGLIAYLERDRLARWVGRLPIPLVIVTFLLSLLLWCAPSVFSMRSLPNFHRHAAMVSVQSLGSLGLLALAVYRPGFSRFLGLRPIVWLGRVSYSLYLFHFSVLLLLAPHLGGSRSWSVGIPLYTAVLAGSLGLAAIGHALVEAPSIRVGNRICQWLARSFGSSSVTSKRADAG